MNHIHPRPLVQKSISLLLFVGDLVATAVAVIMSNLTYAILHGLMFIQTEPSSFRLNVSQNDPVFIVLFPLILFLFYAKGHYTQRIPWWNQVQQIIKICAMAIILDGFGRFVFEMDASHFVLALRWLYFGAAVLLCRQLIFHFHKNTPEWWLPSVIFGDVDTVTDTLYAFDSDPYTGYRVKEVVIRDRKDKLLDISGLPARYSNLNVIYDHDGDYTGFVKAHPEYFFVLCMETFRGGERDKIIDALNKANALFSIIPPTSRVHLFEMEPRYFFGYDVMLLHSKNAINAPIGRILKRALDISATLCALVLLIPIILAVGLGLKIEGQGGTVFYGGYRVGKNGEKFKCWKFRSMEPNTDHLLQELFDKDPLALEYWEKNKKVKNDPRVQTKTAQFIRKMSIDELPQLWNVLVGDMSLVGPRPLLENEIEQYGPCIENYYTARPGITGLWQVSGRSDASFQRRVYWDSWYIRNWNFWGDIIILFKTVRVVLFGSGAY